jgi:ABC-type multidrug transport system ATPase subunit
MGAMTDLRDRPGRQVVSGLSQAMAAATRTDPVVMRARAIAKSYRRGWRRAQRRVLDGVDLDLRVGEIAGLVGENGSGKSTLMRILVGSLSTDAGTVDLDGTLGYCPQEPILYERLTCDEHFDLFGRAYGMDTTEVDVQRGEVYRTLSFETYRQTRVEALSGGTRAKLNLGLALLPDPDVLLLDEPYAGFDWDTYLRFWDLAAARREAGRSLLIVSHFVADDSRFDRIHRLHDGRIEP